ncbi:S-adenosyl-L-methionine-dependent methyltransferase [Piedraia hortae CBS 480.64]|uniref:DNA (cytosine-5-)-methyltransferase n=1 Tax=Piedraia hortae CBS 480.64 TaxID=1314780 RepID=A0A6A7BSJ0_9PEZI|nr:S-adenosyl-L-methionine-dependent methyltransferase [Piedraia hortae CBS 480.64]
MAIETFIDLEDSSDEESIKTSAVSVKHDVELEATSDEESVKAVVSSNSIDLTEDDNNDVEFLRIASPTSLTDDRIVIGSQIESVVSKLGIHLQPGMCVEIVSGEDAGDFLLVTEIRSGKGKHPILVRGFLARRTRRINNMLAKRMNELCLIEKKEIHHVGWEPVDKSLVAVPLDRIGPQRQFILTHEDFPVHSFRETPSFYNGDCTDKEIYDNGVLVCRWRHVVYTDASCVSTKLEVKEEALIRISPGDCIAGFTSQRSGHDARESHRGTPNDEADKQGHSDQESIITPTALPSCVKRKKLDSSSGHCPKRSRTGADSFSGGSYTSNNETDIEHYTYGDICAGAGGTASGAAQAGLTMKFLLDHWQVACDTLQSNFGPSSVYKAKILNTDIFSFCIGPGSEDYRVDILHISFPCQTHSPAHTTKGKNDSANTACGYSVGPILEKCSPRVVTLEQTSGIITHREGWHFRALIHQLTVAGYSVRWQIINMAEYGGPQARKRLIIIASAPGETLPRFPFPTHGKARRLKPFTTIQDCLSLAPLNDDNDMLQFTAKPLSRAYNANTALSQAITCDGGAGDKHPSGGRSFNLRELALLQTFPPEHKFAGRTKTTIRKLIGNAVPCCFATTLFASIAKALRLADGGRDVVVVD